jgi:hypothetical protein
MLPTIAISIPKTITLLLDSFKKMDPIMTTQIGVVETRITELAMEVYSREDIQKAK